jgi:ligand-binding sensor domain-containing protein
VPRRQEREGLVFLASNLDATRWLAGEGGIGLGFREARRLLARSGQLWVATERGVARVDPAREHVEMFEIVEPLALAPAPDGVWVGSSRGLTLIADDGALTRVDVGGLAVLSLLAAGDTLWVGTAGGLGVLEPGARSPRRVDVVPDPVIALARRGDTLVLATPDQLGWRAPGGGWTVLRPRADLGPLAALAPDAEGVWIGGAFGLALWRIASGGFSAVRVPADLPAGVRDVLAAPPYLWVATDSGVVRFRREAVLER